MRITARGVAVLAASLGLLAAGWRINIGEFVTLGIIALTLMFGSLLTVAASGSSARLALTRIGPTHQICGQTAPVTLRITPRRKLKAGTLTDLHSDGVTLTRVQIRERADAIELSYLVTPTQTGHPKLGPLKWQQTDVFGLWVVTWYLGGHTDLVVWPNAIALPICDTFATAHGAGHKIRGSSPDDVTLREYTPGDDLRRIHWPTTARRSLPMVREEGEQNQTAVQVVIDPDLLRNQKTREWALEHGASVACSALDSGHQVRVVSILPGESSQTEFINCPINGRQQILDQFSQFAAASTKLLAGNTNHHKLAHQLNDGPHLRQNGAATYAIVGSSFDGKPLLASGKKYALVVGNSRGAGITASNLRIEGWQVAHTPKPVPHREAWSSLVPTQKGV